MMQYQLINDSYLQWPMIENHQLNDDEVHLWLIEFPDNGQVARFERLHQLKLIRRQLLLDILSNYLSTSLDDSDLDLLASGKPILKHHCLQFNTSHSRNTLLIALHRQHALGIDIEFISKRPIQHFSERFWGELWYEKNLKPIPNSVKPLAFFQAWTGTEAWVKALGETIFNHQDVPLTHFPRQQSFVHQHWQLKHFMPSPLCVVCLCCHTMVKKVFIKKMTIKD